MPSTTLPKVPVPSKRVTLYLCPIFSPIRNWKCGVFLLLRVEGDTELLCSLDSERYGDDEGLDTFLLGDEDLEYDSRFLIWRCLRFYLSCLDLCRECLCLRIGVLRLDHSMYFSRCLSLGLRCRDLYLLRLRLRPINIE